MTYQKEMKLSVLQEIMSDYAGKPVARNKNDLEDQLDNDLWLSDDVTGNASGSYYCNRQEAKEQVLKNGMDILREAQVELDINLEEIARHFLYEEWETLDVIIRCYLLSSIISEVLDELDEYEFFRDYISGEEITNIYMKIAEKWATGLI